MSGTNPNIILGFNPNATAGPNFGNMVQQSQQLLQFRQQQQAQEQQNALLNVFKNPDAVDKTTGLPTTDTLQAVTAINPQIGLQMRQNALVQQDQQVRRDYFKSEMAAKNADRINEAYAPVVENYQERIKGGMPPAEADRMAQAEMSAAKDNLTKAGMSPDLLKQAPDQWNPSTVGLLVHNTSSFRDWQKDQLANQRLKDQEQTERQRGAIQEALPDGTPIIFHPNAPAGHEYTFAATGQPVPADKLKDLTRIGSGAQGSKDQIKRDVAADVDADPNFEGATKGERGLEVLRRLHNAGQGGSIADDPDALKLAADYFAKNNKMPVGFRNKADQDAVLKYLGKSGVSAGDITVQGAETAADSHSLVRVTQQRDAISGYEKGAEREFDLAQSLIPKTPEPFNSQLLTEWARSGEKQFGNVPNAQFYTALTSALDEYAKVLSGGTGSNAASTDSARRQALSIIPPGATTAQIKGIIDIIKQSMDIKRSGYDDQIGEIQTRLRGSSPAKKEEGQQQQGPAQPAQGGGGQPQQSAPVVITDDDAGRAAYAKIPPGQTFVHAGGLFEQGPPGQAPKYLGPPQQSAAQPAQAAAPTAQPTAPTTESQPQNNTAKTEKATPIPPEGIPVPPQYASLPDGQTFGNGKYIKRGDRIYLNENQGGDEFTALQRARTAIQQGAKREDVIKQLRDAGIDPGKL